MNRIVICIVCILLLISSFSMGCIKEEERKKDDSGGINFDIKIDYDFVLNVISDESLRPEKISHHIAHQNEQTQFLLLLKNNGFETGTFKFHTMEPEAGWEYILDGFEDNLDNDNKIQIISGGSEFIILTVKVPETGSVTFRLGAQLLENKSQTSSVEVRVIARDLGNETAKMGNQVLVDYTLADRGTDAMYNENVWAYNQGGEFPFTVGEGVIPGFTKMATGMKEDETRVWLLSEDDCYGSDPYDGKPDGPLVFEMTMLDLDVEY